jgi:hypothetical protein
MTFTSIASNSTQPADYKLTAITTAQSAKISLATLLLSIVSMTVWQALLWMPASHPAELNPTQKQALAAAQVTTTK